METMLTGEENFKGNWPLWLSPRLALLQEAHPGRPCQAQLPSWQDSAEFSMWAAGCDICVLLTQAHRSSRLCLAPPARWSLPICALWTRSYDHHFGFLAVVSGLPLTSSPHC